MKYFLLLLTLVFSNLKAQENFNLDLVSNAPVGEMVNDIWGYVSPEGTEYAIMGSFEATYIFSLQDPAAPREVARIAGSNSTWRDMKTWNEHLYVVADAGDDGLLIVDLREIETDSVRHRFYKPELVVKTDTSNLSQCHNIYIDENGFAYLAGCDITSVNDRGALIFDLNIDPWEPPLVGAETRNYAHDLYVRDNLMYASEIYAGELAIYDVTDKASLVFINSAPTSFNFTHNAWTSEDGDYVFTTDERGNAFVDAFDISDLNDIRKIDRYRPLETEGLGVIPHNTHYHEGFLVTSWYTDGVVVIDASKPDNLIKVGSYDTYPGPHGGFSGCWGAYPFLPSGLVLASDRQTGLYVLRPGYKEAARLQGYVLSLADSSAINGAAVEIISPQANFTESNATGNYKTGLAEGGQYTARIVHPDYRSKEIDVELVNGEVLFKDVYLEPFQRINVRIRVVDVTTLAGIPGAQVKALTPNKSFSFQADSTGLIEATLFDEEYSLVAGAWSYLHKAGLNYNPLTSDSLVIELQTGYQDDFVFDLGWEVSGDAETGHWVRDFPIGTAVPDQPGQFANVNTDDNSDIGEQCYITGNGGGSIGNDDVDNGTTILTSPWIYPKSATPSVSYNIWLYNSGGFSMPDDTLYVKVSDGDESYIIDLYGETTGGWTGEHIVSLAGIPFDLKNGFRLIFETADSEAFGHIVEAGVDAFFLTEEVSTTTVTQGLEFILHPNPFSDRLELEFDDAAERSIMIYDMQGRLLYRQKVSGKHTYLYPALDSGAYILSVNGEKQGQFSRVIIRR